MRLLPRVARPRRRCGCCGIERRGWQVVQLCHTPGVFICHPCAIWAAKRTRRV